MTILEARSALDELLPSRERLVDADVLVATRGLTVQFGGVRALDGVDSSIMSKQVVAIVGPNGAGKTTYLNAISGLLNAQVEGEIEFCGHDVTSRRPLHIARLGLGRSFQHPPLLEDETVIDNILVGAHHHLGYGFAGQLLMPWRASRLEREERDRAHALLEYAGVGHFANQAASSLSYGSRKLVDILRALFLSPRLLALDEPTSGLDAGEKEKVVELITLASSLERMSILLVEHHMDIVRACASQVFGMAAGRVIATGSPTEVFESEAYRRVLVGEPIGTATPEEN